MKRPLAFSVCVYHCVVSVLEVEDVNFLAQKNANLDLILEVNNNPFNLKIKRGKLNIEINEILFLEFIKE